VKVRDNAAPYGLRREVYFDARDLVFEVEGFELGEPDCAEGCFEDEEVGDYFSEMYSSFDEAVRKYLELKEKGWKTVRLRILLKNSEAVGNGCVDFRLFSCREWNSDYFWVSVVVSADELCKSYAEKLVRIKRVLEGDDV